jgi:hypothetical protein
MFRSGYDLQDVYAPAVPIIIPTLESRVHGVFWPGASSQLATGLIVLSEGPVDESEVEQVSALLCARCQMAGISVLDLSQNDIGVEQEAADPYRLGLILLAAIPELRSRGISDVAIIICSGATAPISLQQLQSQLFARCIAASLEPSTTWNDITMRLTGLTETIRSAVNSIRGITYVHTVSEEHEAASRGATWHFEVASSGAVGGKEAQRVSDALYNWTLTTLKPNPAFTVPQHQKPVDVFASLRSSSELLKLAANGKWRAEAARTRIVMQENLRYLQQQWDAMLIDLEERDESRAAKVRTRLAVTLVPSDGNLVDSKKALRAARLTWHLLDKPARYRWLDAWNQAFPALGLHTYLPGSSSTALALPLH